MATTTELLEKYAEHIESIAMYAKLINFDPERDSFDQLMKECLERGRKFQVWANYNKEEAINQTKQALKWM